MWLISLFVSFSLNGMGVTPCSLRCFISFRSFSASLLQGRTMISSLTCSFCSCCRISWSLVRVVVGSMVLWVQVVMMYWFWLWLLLFVVESSSMFWSIHVVLIPLVCRSL